MRRTAGWTASWTALLLAGTVAGCNRAPGNGTAGNSADANSAAALPTLPQALPMQAGASAGAGVAPSAGALPAGQPVRVAALSSPSDGYAYLDRAAGQSEAYGDAPPDYAFDYGGASPWAWQADDGSTEYVEPVDGGYRSYYYQPGEDQPYLVRDGDYSYAYAGAALVAIYLGGRLLPRAQWGDRFGYAARYRERAARLYQASHDDRRGVAAGDWAARRQQIAQQRDAWAADRARQTDWAAYHAQHAAQEQDHWAQDRQQRAAVAQRFDEWRRQDYRGEAPYARPAEGHVPAPSAPVAMSEPARRSTQPLRAGRPEVASPSAGRHPPQAARPDLAREGGRSAPSPELGRTPVPGSDRQHPHEHEHDRGGFGASPPGDARAATPRAEPARAMPHVTYGERVSPAEQIVPPERDHGAPRAAAQSEALRPPPERLQPHAEQPRAATERAPHPEASRVEAPHIEAPRSAPHVEPPHEAPHPAPSHGSEPHGGGDRHH